MKSIPITRRGLLTSSVGVLALSTLPRRACTSTNSPGRDAVTFNKTLLTNGGIPAMPAGLSQKGIISLNWRCSTIPPLGGTSCIIQNSPPPGTLTGFISLFAVNNGGVLSLQLDIQSTGSEAYAIVGPSAVLGSWNQDVIAFDLSVPMVKWLSNGSAITPQIFPGNGTGWGADYTRPWVIGAAGVVSKTWLAPYYGDMADLTLWANQFADPTDPANIPYFYDASSEVPMRTGPTGWFTLPGLIPQICLSGPASQFMQNLAAVTFDPIGTAGAGFHDTTPTSMFTTTNGTLTTAASDPWTDPA